MRVDEIIVYHFPCACNNSQDGYVDTIVGSDSSSTTFREANESVGRRLRRRSNWSDCTIDVEET